MKQNRVKIPIYKKKKSIKYKKSTFEKFMAHNAQIGTGVRFKRLRCLYICTPPYTNIKMKKLDCIWLIDDDEIAIYLADKVIQKVEFTQEVEKFSNGYSALKHLEFCLSIKENLPDLILFDLNMPNMSGWDFIDAFCKIKGCESIPTFIFTSSISARELEKAKLYNCIKGVILKPLCIQKINKMLRLMDVECLAPFEKVFIPQLHSSYYLNTGSGI